MRMYDYDLLKVSACFFSILQKSLQNGQSQWLAEQASLLHTDGTATHFYKCFAIIPRKVDKKLVCINNGEQFQLNSLYNGLNIDSWTTDRLSRCWLLMQLPANDQVTYQRIIENLFSTGEMHELTALYSALPLLAYPGEWVKRCAEGIRSNIGDVLTAIICNNPYPAGYLPEAAWNQLVLKAFFTNQDIAAIYKLNERANASLARSLYDYVKERNEAGRSIHPEIWQCMAPYIGADEMLQLQYEAGIIYKSSLKKI